MIKIKSKEKLAKLLAMEDIDVEHRQVPTAMFDVKNRCLTLPTWKDMPNHLYDLLVGHEVGHALYTPSDEETLKNIIKKTSKHCVNMVEDARIESLMKRRYPGLVKQFYAGYNHLIENDFFGLSTMDVSRINFLDKINLHFKVPSAISGMFEFSADEQVFIDRIENLKSFDEVENVCIDLCEYIKENRQEQDEDDSIFPEDSYTMIRETEDVESEDSEEDEEMDDSQGDEDENDSSAAEDDEESKEGEGEENDDIQNGASGGSPENNDESVNEDLESKTYESFENNIKELADIDTENDYVTIPENISYDNIIDYKEVYKNIDKFYAVDEYMKLESREKSDRYQGWYHSADDFGLLTKTIFENSKKTLDKIKRESVKNVNHMAMEFERKKCADIYKRTSFSKTGVLDTNKMFSAKYNDDVFKKNMKTPEGKNHGLVMFIDWSGSMSTHLQGCVKQLIEFVLFCKKVNIPFEVYSFTDVSSSRGRKSQTFIYKQGDLVCDPRVTFRNYFSSRMNARDLTAAMLKICVITDAFKGGYQHYPIPEEDRLGYTPLNGAVLLSEHVIRDFQKKNNVQEVHSVWITDGEGNHDYHKHSIENPDNIQGRFPNSTRLYNTGKNMVIQDRKTKKNHPISVKGHYRNNITSVLFDIVKDRLGCNVIGFFLDMSFGKKYQMMNHFYKTPSLQTGDASKWMKDARKAGYFVKKEDGYDEYYVISNAPKFVKPVEMDENMTNRKLASMFSAKNIEFKNSRVILSKFIDLITAKM